MGCGKLYLMLTLITSSRGVSFTIEQEKVGWPPLYFYDALVR